MPLCSSFHDGLIIISTGVDARVSQQPLNDGQVPILRSALKGAHFPTGIDGRHSQQALQGGELPSRRRSAQGVVQVKALVRARVGEQSIHHSNVANLRRHHQHGVGRARLHLCWVHARVLQQAEGDVGVALPQRCPHSLGDGDGLHPCQRKSQQLLNHGELATGCTGCQRSADFDSFTEGSKLRQEPMQDGGMATLGSRSKRAECLRSW